MRNERILLIDDSLELLENLEKILIEEGFEVDTASDGAIGIKKIEDKYYDLILTDLKMPNADGIEVLKFVNQNSPESICIILTGFGTIKNAVDAIKMGAFDYLTKPIKSEEILHTIKKALEFRHLKRENIQLRSQLKKKYQFKNIIGDSPSIQKIFEIIEKVADTDSTILIQGESGTGKELIARALHYNSYRREGPFVPVNCAAIPSGLLESELFGHEKGAFTNATRTRIGRFELANGGTLFLDEIGDMDVLMQSKLLRVIQEREFERIGGMKPIKIDIRVIAATHQDLEELVKQGKFREDLFYRLNVISIKMPSLRDRKSDIPLLVNHFIHQFKKSKRKEVNGITNEALTKLMEYDWPGNVRELENTIERMVILTNNKILSVEDLPEKILSPVAKEFIGGIELSERGISLEEAVNEFEKRLILQALNQTGWVKNKAAQLLNVNRTTLIEKMKRQKITPP